MDYFKRFTRLIEAGIKQAIEKKMGADPYCAEEEEYDQRNQIRMFEIDDILENIKDVRKYIISKYWNEYSELEKHKKRIRKEVYPTVWMVKHHKNTFKRFEYLAPMLNYLYNRNRHFSKPEEHKAWRDSMVKKADLVTGGARYNDKYIYSIFIANKQFYKKAAKAIGCSVHSVKKYISAFHKVGIIYKLGKYPVKRKGVYPTLYTDGYFSDFKKLMFIKDDDIYHRALLALPAYLTNKKVIKHKIN